MSSGLGVSLRACVLAGCVLTVLSTTTITQQSSSAWGTLDNGKTVERGTHTSHTTDLLPNGPEVQLDGSLGGGGEQELDVDSGLGFRGGFGVHRERSRPTVPSGEQEQTAQEQTPSSVASQGVIPQPLPGVNDINALYNGLVPQTPNYTPGAQHAWHNYFRQQFPHFVPQWNYQPGTTHQQPRPSISWPTVGLQPSVTFGDPPQQPPSFGPDGGTPVSDGTLTKVSGDAPETPAVEGVGIAFPGDGNPAPSLPSQGGFGGASLPFPNSGIGPIQFPDVQSYVNQLTAQAFGNLARGLQRGIPQFTPQGAHFGGPIPYNPYGSGGYVRHTVGGSVSPPGQPPVQSQHASVDSTFFQRTPPNPSQQTAFFNPSPERFPTANPSLNVQAPQLYDPRAQPLVQEPYYG